MRARHDIAKDRHVTGDAPLVAITHPRLAAMRPALLAQGWRVCLLWEMAAEEAAQVRALAHLGEHVLERAVLDGLPRLGLIANIAVGYDGVDLGYCAARGIAVTHAQGTNAEDVADLAFGLIIGAWRGIGEGQALLRAGRWRPEGAMAPARSLGGRRLGIVGLGAIGQAVARRAAAFRLEVWWWGPRARETAWRRAESLLALAQACDIMVVAARADASSARLISAGVLEALGPHGLLVNVSRGAVVDEDALIAALRDGRLGGAALDVFTEEPTPPERWAGVPNTLLTPHLAGATADVIPALVAQMVGNIAAFLSGRALAGLVGGLADGGAAGGGRAAAGGGDAGDT